MRRRGYEVFRRCVAKACTRVRTAALAEATARPWTARLREALSSEIRAPWRRAHIALDLTDDVKSVLVAATVRAAPSLATAGLDDESHLVELSCMIAFPGATEQAAHADVLGTRRRPLQRSGYYCRTSRSSGPTHVFPDDCDARARTLEQHAARPTHYAPNGEADDVPAAAAAGDDAVPLLGAAGDAAAMDCRLVHYGGANSSVAPRVQLSATFRRGERGGDGFTYQLREGLTLTLGDVVKIHGY